MSKIEFNKSSNEVLIGSARVVFEKVTEKKIFQAIVEADGKPLTYENMALYTPSCFSVSSVATFLSGVRKHLRGVILGQDESGKDIDASQLIETRQDRGRRPEYRLNKTIAASFDLA